MLLKCFILFLLSFNLYAWEIKSQNNQLKLVSGEKSYPLTFNSEAKLLSVIEKEHYTQIEYNAGKTGTQEMIEVFRRMIINKKGEIIVDRPFEYRSEKTQISQPSWNFSEKARFIEVQDAEEDFSEIFSY